MQKTTYIAYLFAFILGMSSCGQSEETPAAAIGMPICWEVTSVGEMQSSRALIGSGIDDMTLETACTNAEAIAVWGTYTHKETAEEENAFEDTPLTYNNTSWSYTGGYRYWMNHTEYRFRAYFPKNALQNHVTKADVDNITIDYDTEALQEDLLLAYQEVDADENKGKKVPLAMQHALAAIRFQFQTMDGSTMYLQSFSLNNTTAGNGLSTFGTLIYGDDVKWNLYTPSSGRFYEWAYEGSEGLPFNNSKATAYQQPANDGTEYTENQGYVLILPQTYNGGTKLNFTLDGKPLSADLPVRNFLPGYRYTYLINITPDNAVTLTCSVMPWTLKEEDMDFVNYVNMDADGQLEWLSGSVNNDAENKVNEVFMNTETIQCSFHIATPEGAMWYATLVPLEGNDMNAFTFVDGVGNEKGITTSGQVGEEAILTIKRKNIKEYTRMRLQLIVKDLNGRTFVVHKDVLGSENYIWSQP